MFNMFNHWKYLLWSNLILLADLFWGWFLHVTHRSRNTCNDWGGGGGRIFAQEWLFNKLFTVWKHTKFVVTCRYNYVFLLYGNPKFVNLTTTLTYLKWSKQLFFLGLKHSTLISIIVIICHRS